MFLLVRNQVQDVDRWKRVFGSQMEAAQDTGMRLVHLWQSVDQKDQVFFVFEVEDRGRAEQYMSTPEATAVGVEAGVIDGEFHFLESLTD